MGLIASSGKTMYWEPAGYSIPLHVVGPLKGAASLSPGPKDQCEQCGAAYAIVKANELRDAVPEHPYVAFMDLYRVRKYSRHETGSELGRYRAFMLDQMLDVFQRKCDSDDDRWKDITLMDLKEMTLYICDHWRELGIYAHQATYDLQARHVSLDAWFRAWRRSMSEEIGPLYADKRQRQAPDAPSMFVAELARQDTGRQDAEEPKPLAAAKPEATRRETMPDIADGIMAVAKAARETEPVPVKEAILLKDEDTNDQVLGQRTLHNITCVADLVFTMQFDVVESTLKQCVDLVGPELCDVVDDIKVGPDNFVQVKLKKVLADSYPIVLDEGALDTPFKTVEFIYAKLVSLAQCVAATQEALHAHVVH